MWRRYRDSDPDIRTAAQTLVDELKNVNSHFFAETPKITDPPLAVWSNETLLCCGGIEAN